MLRLSIIIPVYNVAAYIERCIESLEEQDIGKEEYELICINDGSTDNSLEVLEKLKDKFGNISIINQENRGVSCARNRGIDLAKGIYLLFVDGDDYLFPNTIKEKIDTLSVINPDIGVARFITLDKKGQFQYSFILNITNNDPITGVDFYNNYYKGNYEIRGPDRSVAIFFRRKFFQEYGLKYIPGIPYLEDGELLSRVFALSEKAIFLKGDFYIRTTREGSATNSNLYFSLEARAGFLKATNNLLEFKKGNNLSIGQKTFLNQPIVKFSILYLTSFKVKNCIEYSRLIKRLRSDFPNRFDTQGCNSLYKFFALSYNASIHFFYLNWFLFRIYRSFLSRIKYLCN